MCDVKTNVLEIPIVIEMTREHNFLKNYLMNIYRQNEAAFFVSLAAIVADGKIYHHCQYCLRVRLTINTKVEFIYLNGEGCALLAKNFGLAPIVAFTGDLLVRPNI